MPDNLTIRLNDIEVTLTTCGHCGARPGEAEAARAIAERNVQMGTHTCVVCGLELRPRAFKILHVDTGTATIWTASPDISDWRRLVISLTPTRCDSAFDVHVGCLRSVLPNLPAEVLRQT